MSDNSRIVWVIDLDGVVWRGADTVPGSPEAVVRLRELGHPVAFVTNSALRTSAQVAAKLDGHGIHDAESEVITSAMAAAELVKPGERVLCVGMDGVREALHNRGVDVVDGAPADAVVVGITPDFNYDTITMAMRAVHGGARLIATNDDATYPDAGGLLPGNGALVAAIERATGVKSEVAGKPHAAMATLVQRQLGSRGVVVGDRPETDGLFARALGYDFILVLSGVVSRSDLPVEPAPVLVADDFLAAVELQTAAIHRRS